MRRLFAYPLAFLIAAIFSLSAMADNRVALVVGNSRYETAGTLANPENDAQLMADTLRSLGFTVVGGGAQLNLGEDKFRHIVKQFGDQLRESSVGLFYYAGHGVEIDGSNYLVPVDADVTKEADVDFLLDVNLVLRQMAGARTKLNVVILDACRNNPFASGRAMAMGRGRDSEEIRMRDIGVAKGGLAQMSTPESTLIAFATQPGQTAADGGAGDSPYTRAMAEVIKTPGLGVLDVFNQVGMQVQEATRRNQRPQRPWFSSSPLGATFYFVPSGGAGAVSAATVTRSPAPEAPLGAANPAASQSAQKPPNAAEIAQKYEAEQRVAALEQNGAAGQRSQSKLSTGFITPEQTALPVAPLTAEQEHALKPADRFKECKSCPEMVMVPAGTFVMGSPATEAGHEKSEEPQQQIVFGHPFAVGRTAVTFDEWNACVAEGGCDAYRPGDYGWGGGKRPVINISWDDAEALREMAVAKDRGAVSGVGKRAQLTDQERKNPDAEDLRKSRCLSA